ncbi:MAG: germination lipoprotein GerS [Terrisporobacter sp.]|uniref:germination lipoprotein GerS n=1 Tax=Terrisporobacter sp. TaxID=1965305 RepID=UPI002FC72719
MKKKWSILLITLALGIIVIIIGCARKESTKEEVYEDFQKRLTQIESYTCTAKVEAIGNKTNTTYVLTHTYSKPDYYKLEVKSPEHLKGKTIEYKGEKIIIHNPSIDDEIELPSVQNNGTYLFIGDFIENYLQNEAVILSSSNTKLKVEIEIPGDNKYFNKQILYVNNKTKNPEKMEIIDYEGLPRFIVTYEDFKYEK